MLQEDGGYATTTASTAGNDGPPGTPSANTDRIKIEKLQRQVEALKFGQKAEGAGNSSGAEVQWLKDENAQLKARVMELESALAADKGLREANEALQAQVDSMQSARERIAAAGDAQRGEREAVLLQEVEELRARVEKAAADVAQAERARDQARDDAEALQEKLSLAEARASGELKDAAERAERAEAACEEAQAALAGQKAAQKKGAVQLKIKQAVGVAIMEELQNKCQSAKVREVAQQVKQQLMGDITNEALQSIAPGLHTVVEHVALAESAKWKELYGHEHRARKRIHNDLMDLKGNIRVFTRARPMDPGHESGEGHREGVKVVNDMTLQALDAVSKGMRSFDFDCVFGPASSQEEVFQETEGLVTSVLDGFNVCIFAYGQTGSGKTFTMEGPQDNPGVNLRALGRLFEIKQEKADSKAIAIQASAIEIYNEAVRDLLGDDPQRKLDIKQGAQGTYVQDLVQADVASPADVEALMQRARSNRSTFSTNMNEHSSRSHSILTVYVDAKDLATGERTRSKLHLVDLAGSERLSKSGATGDRLLEAQAINKSLSALGDVIQALQTKQAHVPYRNSKLTYLMSDSIGGNAKTLMILAVSPSTYNAQETITTLRWGQRAMKVTTGPATKNVVQDGDK